MPNRWEIGENNYDYCHFVTQNVPGVINMHVINVPDYLLYLKEKQVWN